MKKVVFAPDLLGKSFSDPASFQVLLLWRKGEIQPAVNPTLLRQYLRLFQRLGMRELLIRRWAWWFTAPATASYCAVEFTPEPPALESCARLAQMVDAVCIIHGGIVEEPAMKLASGFAAIRWRRASDFLAASNGPLEVRSSDEKVRLESGTSRSSAGAAG